MDTHILKQSYNKISLWNENEWTRFICTDVDDSETCWETFLNVSKGEVQNDTIYIHFKNREKDIIAYGYIHV